jgi:hypothetical protein
MKVRTTRKRSKHGQSSKHVSQTWSDDYAKWAQQFSADAIKDNYAAFKREIVHLDLPAKPKDMLEPTLLVVQACLIYGSSIDGRQYQRFLRQQTYEPESAREVSYTLTFDLGKKRFGRLLATPRLAFIDLADLYEHPWLQLETAGYGNVWFSRLDHDNFKRDELSMLDKRIQRDLRYDYTEEELYFWFDETDIGVASLYTCPNPPPD